MAPDSDPPASVTVRASKRARRVSVDRVRSRGTRSEEHTSELQSQSNLVCRLLLEKKNSTEDDFGLGRRRGERVASDPLAPIAAGSSGSASSGARVAIDRRTHA